MKVKDTFKKGTRIEICYCAELTGLKGIVENTFHDHCTYGHAEWVQVKLDNGTTKTLRTSFIREV